MRYESINPEKAIQLYEQYGSVNKTAMKIGCCAKTLRKVLTANNIQINEPKSNRWSKRA